MDDPTGADRAYEWTMRLLYAALITAELALIWKAWSTTASGLEWQAKIKHRLAHVKDCQPCAKRRAWLRDRARMLWQATEIVEEAAGQPEGGGEP